MKPIRVLHILEATIGGTRKHFLQIAQNINRELVELCFILSPLRDPDTTARDAEYLEGLGFSVELVDMQREIKPGKDLASLVALTSKIRKLNPDIIHTHASKAGILGRTAALLSGVSCRFHTPHLWSFDWESSAYKRCLYRFVEMLAAKVTTKIIAVSASQIDTALKNRVADHSRLILLHNAIENMEEKKTLKPDEELRVFGFAGRLVEQKSVDVLIKAFETVAPQMPGTKLVIGGSGKLENELKKQAANTACSRSIEFIGEVNDIYGFMRDIDIFVLPSRWEGYPYAALEAMVSGTPIIASAIAGNDEIVLDEFNGRLFRSEDDYDLAQKMIIACKYPGHTRRFADSALQTAHKFSPAAFCRKLEWHYLCAAENKGFSNTLNRLSELSGAKIR